MEDIASKIQPKKSLALLLWLIIILITGILLWSFFPGYHQISPILVQVKTNEITPLGESADTFLQMNLWEDENGNVLNFDTNEDYDNFQKLCSRPWRWLLLEEKTELVDSAAVSKIALSSEKGLPWITAQEFPADISLLSLEPGSDRKNQALIWIDGLFMNVQWQDEDTGVSYNNWFLPDHSVKDTENNTQDQLFIPVYTAQEIDIKIYRITVTSRLNSEVITQWTIADTQVNGITQEVISVPWDSAS